MALARRAAGLGIQLTIDAEEADRLDLSLDVIEALARDPATRDWSGLGLAVQAYGKRALEVIDWVAATRAHYRQTHDGAPGEGCVLGFGNQARRRNAASSGYPVYTRKVTTDVSYLACAGPLVQPCRCDLSAVCDAQRAQHRIGAGAGAGRRGL